MSSQDVKAIHGAYVLSTENDELSILANRWVVVEGDRISDITKDAPDAATRYRVPEALVMPGLINCHNHGASSVMFRGLTEDWPAESFETELIYGLLLPLGDLALQVLEPEEMGSVVELALLELIKGGTTTLMEVFRPGQQNTFEAAAAMGLRFYGAPYLFSTAKMDMDEVGNPTYEAVNTEQSDLDRFHAIYQRHDGTYNDRLRVAIGPHGLDSCDPDLLKAVRATADDLGVLINVHVCQTQAEIELLRSRYDMTPTEYMESVGLLGPDVLAAHCLHASDADLERLAATDTTIVNCPMTFARGGVSAVFERFDRAGARTVVGTDGYYMDMVAELRSAGVISKLNSRDSGAALAYRLMKAATLDSAHALKRTDLGRLEVGAKADLMAVSLNKPHFQPVSDPIKTYLWNARGAEPELLMVDGETLIEGGEFIRKNEQDIIDTSTRAIRKVWRAAADSGIRHVPQST